MKLEEISVILGRASLVFSNYSLTPETIRAWHSLFTNEEAELFHAALAAVIKEPGRKFFPSPGEVTEALNTLQRGQVDPAEEAWERIRHFSQRGGHGLEEYLIGNPTAQVALRQIGGFKELQFADVEKDMPFRRRDFLRCYESTLKRSEEVLRMDSARELPSVAKAALAAGSIKRIAR